METPIVKTSAEFKETVTSIIRAMALDEFLLVPKQYIDDGINSWLERGENGECPAQEDYKCYYQFIMTIPPEMHVLDMDLYYLRVARRIVDNILLTMLDTSYYKSVFNYAEAEKEQYQLIYEVTTDLLNRIEENQDGSHVFKNTKELRKEFEKYYSEVLEDA